MYRFAIVVVFSVVAYAQTTANLWVATSPGTCTRSASQVPYTASTACSSFAAAWGAASAGDTILVRAGTYPAQTIAKPDKSGTTVTTFGAENGTGVTVASLYISASYVEVDNIALTYDSTSVNPGGINIGDGAQSDTSYTTHVTVKNGTAQTVFIVGQYITLLGGSYGNYDPCQSSSSQEDTIDVWCNNACSMESRYITFDGVTIHDNTDHGNTCSGLPGSGRHIDGAQFLGGTNITIRNSSFYNNATSNIMARPYMGAALGNWTVENNFMGATIDGGNGLCLGATTDDTLTGTNLVRYNTMEQDMVNIGAGTIAIYGNILNNNSGLCVAHGTWSYNVFDGSYSGCGTNSKHASALFVSNPSASFRGPAPDLHLVSNSTAAHAAGDPSNYPATDIDGQVRISPPDAGADQYSGGTLPQPPSSLQVVVK